MAMEFFVDGQKGRKGSPRKRGRKGRGGGKDWKSRRDRREEEGLSPSLLEQQLRPGLHLCPLQ